MKKLIGKILIFFIGFFSTMAWANPRTVDLLLVLPAKNSQNKDTVGCTDQTGWVPAYSIGGNGSVCAHLGLPGIWFSGTAMANALGQVRSARQAIFNTVKNSLYNYRIVGVVLASRTNEIFYDSTRKQLRTTADTRERIMVDNNINYYRNYLSADVVVSFLDTGVPGGAGPIPNQANNPANAFLSISYRLDMDDEKPILAHEIGHVFGLSHDPIIMTTYNDTYYFSLYSVGSYKGQLLGQNPPYGDIMSYPNDGIDARELRYSSATDFDCGPNKNLPCSFPYGGFSPDAKKWLFGNNSQYGFTNAWDVISSFR